MGIFSIFPKLYRLVPVFLCDNTLARGERRYKIELTLWDLIKKRKSLWEKHRDPSLDKELVEAIADEILDREEIRCLILERPYLLIEACFSVVNKERKTVPFFLNPIQKDFLDKLQTQGRSKPYFILKSRQQGFTTLITAIGLSFAITTRNFSGFTLADREDNARAIFLDKAKLMYDMLPERLKPLEKLNSANELFFDRLNSSWRVSTASESVGRSRTLSFIHYSEVAFYRCPLSQLQKSISEAGVKDALCIYETTANGFNEAKALWDSGVCVNLFYPWYLSSEYRENDPSYKESADSWLKNRLGALKRRGLDESQLNWYARKYKMYLDKSAIRQEYPSSPEEAFVSSGRCIFDSDAISHYLSCFDIKPTPGYFTYKERTNPVYLPDGRLASASSELYDIKFIPDQNGYISIVDMPYTQDLGSQIVFKPYVIGADTAGSGEDYFTAKVLDNTTGRCVATLRKKHFDEDLFAKQLFCLGKFYNDALIGVESNFSAHPVRVLKSLGYPNLYSSKGTSYDSTGSYLGFITTSVTRPIIIANLVSIMRDNLLLETDRQTLIEMTSFVRHENGRASASSGAHDDLVMASAIAHFISGDFSKKVGIIDTGSSVLENNFTKIPLQEETFMEW